MQLSNLDKLMIRIQRIVSHCLFILIGPLMLFLFKYKFKYVASDIDAIRRKYQEILKTAPGPVILCPNHLTLIDSIIIALILNSNWRYLMDFSSLAWNFPEKKNFSHNFSWKLLCYLGKCLSVQRMSGPKNSQKSLAQMHYLLSLGDVISIFPEGKRSRSGFVDDKDYSYGVGMVLKDLPEAMVVCIYLRGRNNGGFARFPDVGERFYFDMRPFTPRSENSGLKKARTLSEQIILNLKNMENEYLEYEGIRR